MEELMLRDRTDKARRLGRADIADLEDAWLRSVKGYSLAGREVVIERTGPGKVHIAMDDIRSIEVQPDLGTTAIIIGAAACVFFVAGANLVHIALLAVAGAVAEVDPHPGADADRAPVPRRRGHLLATQHQQTGAFDLAPVLLG